MRTNLVFNEDAERFKNRLLKNNCKSLPEELFYFRSVVHKTCNVLLSPFD